MTALLQTLLASPMVFFTLPLGVVSLYWLTVLVGVMDMDAFDGVDVDLDVEVDLDVDADVEVDADADADAEAPAEGVSAIRWLAAALRLGKVPVTITATLLLFSGWCTTFAFVWFFGATPPIPPPAFDAAVLAASTTVATALTNLLSRPLEPVFQTNKGRSRKSLIGEVCEVSTGRVDAGFGQATAMIQGDDLLFQVRCDTAANSLNRGARALIVSFDKDREAYVVEPLDRAQSVSNPTSQPAHQAGRERTPEA